MRRNFELIDDCNVYECQHLLRHYRNNSQPQLMLLPPVTGQGESEEDIMFYIDILDTVHCFWFHCYEIGIRIKGTEEIDEDLSNDEDLRICKTENIPC